MPETDGGEVAARFNPIQPCTEYRLSFWTALVTKAEGRSGLRIQGHPFLAKPISLSDLITGIEENLLVRAGV